MSSLSPSPKRREHEQGRREEAEAVEELALLLEEFRESLQRSEEDVLLLSDQLSRQEDRFAEERRATEEKVRKLLAHQEQSEVRMREQEEGLEELRESLLVVEELREEAEEEAAALRGENEELRRRSEKEAQEREELQREVAALKMTMKKMMNKKSDRTRPRDNAKVATKPSSPSSSSSASSVSSRKRLSTGSHQKARQEKGLVLRDAEEDRRGGEDDREELEWKMAMGIDLDQDITYRLLPNAGPRLQDPEEEGEVETHPYHPHHPHASSLWQCSVLGRPLQESLGSPLLWRDSHSFSFGGSGDAFENELQSVSPAAVELKLPSPTPNVSSHRTETRKNKNRSLGRKNEYSYKNKNDVVISDKSSHDMDPDGSFLVRPNSKIARSNSETEFLDPKSLKRYPESKELSSKLALKKYTTSNHWFHRRHPSTVVPISHLDDEADRSAEEATLGSPKSKMRDADWGNSAFSKKKEGSMLDVDDLNSAAGSSTNGLRFSDLQLQA